MIIKYDAADPEEIEDEFTELLRQIDEQRQIESPLGELEMRDGAPAAVLGRAGGGDNSSHLPPRPTMRLAGATTTGPQRSVAPTSKGGAGGGMSAGAATVVTPSPKRRLPLLPADAASAGPVPRFTHPSAPPSSDPHEAKLPVVAKRNGPENETTTKTEKASLWKAPPRRVMLKKVGRNPAVDPTVELPTPSRGDAASGPTSDGPAARETELTAELRTTATVDGEDQGTGIGPDCAMDMLLEEMEEYVAENNMLYHETSPEKAPRTPLFEFPDGAEPSFDVSDPRLASLAPPSSLEDCLDDSFDSAREEQKDVCEEDSKEDAPESHSPPAPPKRRVRFADDHGLPLLSIVHLDPIMATEGRLVILLLSPPERTFEFIQVEYPMDDSTSTDDLVQQLPGLATNAVFQEPDCFAGLSRIRTLRSENPCNSTTPKTKSSQEEEDDNSVSDSSSSSSASSSTNSTAHSYRLPTLLDPTLLMRDVDFGNCELVLAVLGGYTPAEMVTIAFPLLLNGKIMKAVQSGRRSGRGLKYMLSGKGWRRQRLELALKLEEERKDWHEQFTYKEWAVVDDLADNVIVFEIDMDEYAESWEEMTALKGACSVDRDETTSSKPNVWDEWCAEFDQEETARKHKAEALVDEEHGDIHNCQPNASIPYEVDKIPALATVEQGDTTSGASVNREVKTAEKESSPRSVMGAPRGIGGKTVPFPLPYDEHACGNSDCDTAQLKIADEALETLVTNPEPTLWGFLGGQQGAESCILMIYSLSIAGAAGLLYKT